MTYQTVNNNSVVLHDSIVSSVEEPCTARNALFFLSFLSLSLSWWSVLIRPGTSRVSTTELEASKMKPIACLSVSWCSAWSCTVYGSTGLHTYTYSTQLDSRRVTSPLSHSVSMNAHSPSSITRSRHAPANTAVVTSTNGSRFYMSRDFQHFDSCG